MERNKTNKSDLISLFKEALIALNQRRISTTDYIESNTSTRIPTTPSADLLQITLNTTVNDVENQNGTSFQPTNQNKLDLESSMTLSTTINSQTDHTTMTNIDDVFQHENSESSIFRTS